MKRAVLYLIYCTLLSGWLVKSSRDGFVLGAALLASGQKAVYGRVGHK